MEHVEPMIGPGGGFSEDRGLKQNARDPTAGALSRIAWLLIPLLLTACAVREVDGPSIVSRTSAGPDRQDYYVVVTRREGASQTAVVMKPATPAAAVILFMGGPGRANVSPRGAASGNFLIRSQRDFFEENLMVAIVDVPSDRSTLEFFRNSEAHAIDIAGVIAELRKLAEVPVWAVGTSNGSASVANVASRFPPSRGPDGIVLTSSVERSDRGNSVFDASLGRIRVPALVVHHKDDACPWTPYRGAIHLKDALSASPARELIGIDGGSTPYGDPCEPYHYHGFIGRERQVVKIIADWIKAHPTR
jgi:pimeloyl-ACP methyl ester carboxylesterase